MVDKSNETFSPEEDRALVEHVSKYDVLFNLKNPAFKDQEMRYRIWTAVADRVGRSVDDCKKRWKNIRDTYHRRQKKRYKGELLHEQVRHSSGWPLAEMLTFLDRTGFKKRIRLNQDLDSSTNINNGFDNTDSESESDEAQKSDVPLQLLDPEPLLERPVPFPFRKNNFRISGKKKKSDKNRDGQIKYQKNEEDSVDLFFRSMAASLKKLKPELVNEAKIRTLQMVIELEGRDAVSAKK